MATETSRSPLAGKWILLLVVVAVALAAAALAPEPWPPGAGQLEINYRGRTAITAAVVAGDNSPQTHPAQIDGANILVALPQGVPVDRPIEIEATVEGAPLVLGDIGIALVLANGDRERIPVLRVDGNTAIAARRPPQQAAVVLGMLAAAVVLWVSELVPLFVTSLAIPVVLTIAGAGPARDTLSPFFDPIIVLFFAGFLLAAGMSRVGLDRWAAVWLVSVARGGPVRLFAALIGTAAFLSMWMSNTAAVALMLPIALAITAPLQNLGYRKAVVLGIAYAATIGGVGSAIGTPANPLAISFIASLTGREISFAGWFLFGLPMVVLFLPIMGFYLWRTGGVRPEPELMQEAADAALAERARSGRLSRPQIQVLVVFAAIFAGWLSQTWHGVSPGIVALGGVIVLLAAGKVVPDDLGHISWATLLTFGGGLTLGVFMTESGTSDWLVTRLGDPGNLPSLVAMMVVALVALGLTTVASNTAAAATLVPLAVPLAGVMGIDPVLMVMVVAIATSVDFALVIGTPPTMLAYSTELFTAREILRRGAPLDMIGILLLVLAVIPLWRLFGLI